MIVRLLPLPTTVRMQSQNKRNDINIVLTDVKMPLLDGIGLAKYIHENRPDIAVIIFIGIF